MSNRHSRRAFERRKARGEATEEELVQEAKIAEAQIMGQAFESSLQYRQTVELMISEAWALHARLKFRDPDKKKLRKEIAKLETRLTAARAFVLHCGFKLIEDVPLNPAENLDRRIIMPDTPKIVIPDPVIEDAKAQT
jgi:hypothetical protein